MNIIEDRMRLILLEKAEAATVLVGDVEVYMKAVDDLMPVIKELISTRNTMLSINYEYYGAYEAVKAADEELLKLLRGEA